MGSNPTISSRLVIMKFYIPASTRYVEFQTDHDITVYNVYEADGSYSKWLPQFGKSPLEDHELISVGQIIEIHKQVKNGTREYDPYAIYPESMRPK